MLRIIIAVGVSLAAFVRAERIAKPLIVADGYLVTEHFLTTSDGYNLKLFNIPGSAKQPAAANKTVVLLQHGMDASAADWVVQVPEKSIAYMLVDAGYDVWLGNARGNTYSRSHESLSPKQAKFWDFTWHEMGIIDLPELINYILNETKKENLHYIGHSQGTTSFFVMGALRPEMNMKIRTMHAFAPVVFQSHAKAPLFRLPSWLMNLLFKLGYHEFLPAHGLLGTMGRLLCTKHSPLLFVCKTINFILFGGFDYDQMSDDVVVEYSKHTPAGASVKQLVHYLQSAESGKFRPFETSAFGPFADDYNLTKVVAPVYLHYGANDWIGAAEDIPELASKLGNLKLSREVPLKAFNHLDFTYAKDADTLLYKKVIAIIQAN